MTGHLLGLIVKANTGEEKKRHKGCNIGLLDGQGRPNTASCRRVTERTVSLLPSLADGEGAGSCSTQRCKDGQVIPECKMKFPRPIEQ